MDTISPERRIENMRRIQSKGTAAEVAVRRLVHSMGYRYRLHHKGLPGKPDMVFPSRRKVIFVHGCFWHQHNDEHCRIVREPKSNRGYWVPKLERNKERDLDHEEALAGMGWQAVVVWECEVEGNMELVRDKVRLFLG